MKVFITAILGWFGDVILRGISLFGAYAAGKQAEEQDNLENTLDRVEHANKIKHNTDNSDDKYLLHPKDRGE